MNLLTQDILKSAIDKLRENSKIENYEQYWVDNKYFYLGEIAEVMGMQCTEEELDIASRHEHGFIAQKRGVKLYLTKLVSVKF